MAWTSILTAPTDGEVILARDEDGSSHYTSFDFGDWVHKTWRENEDRDEFECDEVWWPNEWMAPDEAP